MQVTDGFRRRLMAGAAVGLVLGAAPAAAFAQAATSGAVNAGQVSATGAASTAPAGVTKKPTQKQIFHSSQSVRVLNRAQMDQAGPVGGAAQVLSYAPGANVVGYGNSGATKYTVTINGVNQGWGGYGGHTDNGSLGITFDGVPIVDPATSLWQSPTLPQMSLFQNTNITYGPGLASNRWYSNIGGSVEFTPIQPSLKPGGSLELTYGSYDQKNLSFSLRTGSWHGWSTVLAGGFGNGNSFRSASDGFQSPNEDYAFFAKTIKTFATGDFSVGLYDARSGGYRAQVIPVAANPAITTTGAAGAPLYSQQSSGFYSTLPFSSYDKKDFNEMLLTYGRLDQRLDDTTTLHDLAWYMHIARGHSRLTDVYSLGPQQNEWNTPHTNVFGDKLWLTESLPYNTIDAGLYYIHTFYNSRNNFYNVADGGNKTVVNIGGKIRSSDYTQDNFALFLQDRIRPIPMLHITPGIRFVTYNVGYSNSALQDFQFAPGVALSSHCLLNGTSTAGNTKDQGASCGANEFRQAVEPSLDVSINPLSWLTLYGGYEVSTRAPSMGGGGGLFQSVDPTSYHLALAQYYQFGFKAHVRHFGPLRHFLFGAAYFHLRYAKQEIDTSLANGDTISANGTSVYNGVNLFLDDNPVAQLHVFANATIEGAKYTSYITGGTSYNGAPVAYVPDTTFNLGGYYDFLLHSTLIEPRAWYQFVGSQHIFDNTTGAPSSQTMPGYGTLNLAVKTTVPLHLPGGWGTRYLDLKLTALNVLDRKYNIYEYVSSGGYFGTPTGGYLLAYPGAPFTIYGSIGLRF